MKVKALKKLLYNGEVHPSGSVFEMDECTAAISKKYGTIKEVIENAAAVEEVEVAGLPPLDTSRKRK